MEIRPIDAEATYQSMVKTIAAMMHTRRWMRRDESNEEEILSVIQNAPTLDYAPVRHGEWTLVEKFFPCGEEGEVDSDWFLVCSECGREVPVYEYWPPDIDIEKLTEEYPYCHCGAKMDGGKENGKNSDA